MLNEYNTCTFCGIKYSTYLSNPLENQGCSPGKIHVWKNNTVELGGGNINLPCNCIRTGEYSVDVSNCKVHGIQKAARDPVNFRYDILDKDFLKVLAEIAHYGAEKYGDNNWKKSRLTAANSPLNHIYEHLRQYTNKEPYDHFDGNIKYHLASIAFNAMMEFYYLLNCKLED